MVLRLAKSAICRGNHTLGFYQFIAMNGSSNVGEASSTYVKPQFAYFALDMVLVRPIDGKLTQPCREGDG
jgi:hypothetical protein